MRVDCEMMARATSEVRYWSGCGCRCQTETLATAMSHSDCTLSILLLSGLGTLCLRALITYLHTHVRARLLMLLVAAAMCRCWPRLACRTPRKWTGAPCCPPLCPICMTTSLQWQPSWRKHTQRCVIRAATQLHTSASGPSRICTQRLE